MEFTGIRDQYALLKEEIHDGIMSVLESGAFIMGEQVGHLERELGVFSGAKHSIAVANGTDALQLALMVHGVGVGDAVFVPSFTYTATAEVILLLGAVPVFVDVEESTFNIDPEDLKLKIEEVRKAGKYRCAAIMGVDLFGRPADWPTLNTIAETESMVLIADAAQAFGGEIAGKKIGTLAPITTTSFFPAKPLGCYGDGGAIFTDDDELAAALRSLRVHGQGKAKYETVRIGVNSRLDTLQAAILLPKLRVYAQEMQRRDELAARYNSLLQGMVITPRQDADIGSAWAQYTIRTSERDRLQAGLKQAGIPSAVYYPLPMHLQPAYKVFGDGAGSLPVSEKMCSEVLSLPMNPYWKTGDAERVCSEVRNVLTA